jgi:hypothetical protein
MWNTINRDVEKENILDLNKYSSHNISNFDRKKKENILDLNKYSSHNISNFDRKKKENISKVLKEYYKTKNHLKVFLKDEAYTRDGQLLEDCVSLETKSTSENHGEFWDFFNKKLKYYEDLENTTLEQLKNKNIKEYLKTQNNQIEVDFGY